MSISEQLKKLINEAEAIIIGAGSGLSTSAGFNYSGERFMKYFKYMHDLYGYSDMYSAGFHHFDSEEEKWGYWSKYIYINRFEQEALPLYKQLLRILQNKNYFVITTNVDHQFQLAGFDRTKLFYTQGDYGLFQCSIPCHEKTYDNEVEIKEMINRLEGNKIPTSLIPKCPKCGELMEMNLRADERFVEDEGWHNAKNRYEEFINENKDKKILFLELGVGYNTPVIIKYPFMKMVYLFPNATYISICKEINYIPKEIKSKSYVINDDIFNTLKNF